MIYQLSLASVTETVASKQKAVQINRLLSLAAGDPVVVIGQSKDRSLSVHGLSSHDTCISQCISCMSVSSKSAYTSAGIVAGQLQW